MVCAAVSKPAKTKNKITVAGKNFFILMPPQDSKLRLYFEESVMLSPSKYDTLRQALGDSNLSS